MYPLVEIGLTDLPKSGDAMAPPATLGATGLISMALVGPLLGLQGCAKKKEEQALF